MPKKKIGFLRSEFIRKNSRVFISLGGLLLGVIPTMGIKLKQSGIATEYRITAREYLSICFFLFVLAFVGVSVVISGLLLMVGSKNPILGGKILIGSAEFSKDLIIGPVFGAIIGFFLFFQTISYPKVIVNRRVRAIDRNLLFVLRTILVQIRSGVPIFDTFVSIATGDYGEISTEFRGVIERVGAGKPVIESLEELAVRNPSVYFRKALWQLVNALKSGSDVGDNLENVIGALSKEQIVEIRKYQSTLNPLAMMYMMIAVIVPSLGITVMIILSTFPGMESIGNENTFWLLLIGAAFMQFMFMSVIKSKRPNLMT
jgi:pilus assembly protein TadC